MKHWIQFTIWLWLTQPWKITISMGHFPWLFLWNYAIFFDANHPILSSCKMIKGWESRKSARLRETRRGKRWDFLWTRCEQNGYYTLHIYIYIYITNNYIYIYTIIFIYIYIFTIMYIYIYVICLNSFVSLNLTCSPVSAPYKGLKTSNGLLRMMKWDQPKFVVSSACK